MDAARRERLRSYASREHGVDINSEAVERIARHVGLIIQWNKTTRLTGPTDEAALVEHHVADCLSLVSIVPPTGTLTDIGSGAGFPGVVIQSVRTEATATLIEPRRRRASFLAELIRSLPLRGTTVVCARAEALPETRNCDVVVSRALRIDVFLPLALRFLQVGGVAVAMQSLRQDAGPAGDEMELLPPIEYALPDGSMRRLLLYRRLC